MMLIESMVTFLEEPLPAAAGYAEAYLVLAERLTRWAASQKGPIWTASTRQFFHDTADAIHLWVDACEVLAG